MADTTQQPQAAKPLTNPGPGVEPASDKPPIDLRLRWKAGLSDDFQTSSGDASPIAFTNKSLFKALARQTKKAVKDSLDDEGKCPRYAQGIAQIPQEVFQKWNRYTQSKVIINFKDERGRPVQDHVSFYGFEQILVQFQRLFSLGMGGPSSGGFCLISPEQSPTRRWSLDTNLFWSTILLWRLCGTSGLQAWDIELAAMQTQFAADTFHPITNPEPAKEIKQLTPHLNSPAAMARQAKQRGGGRARNAPPPRNSKYLKELRKQQQPQHQPQQRRPAVMHHAQQRNQRPQQQQQQHIPRHHQVTHTNHVAENLAHSFQHQQQQQQQQSRHQHNQNQNPNQQHFMHMQQQHQRQPPPQQPHQHQRSPHQQLQRQQQQQQQQAQQQPPQQQQPQGGSGVAASQLQQQQQFLLMQQQQSLQNQQQQQQQSLLFQQQILLKQQQMRLAQQAGVAQQPPPQALSGLVSQMHISSGNSSGSSGAGVQANLSAAAKEFVPGQF